MQVQPMQSLLFFFVSTRKNYTFYNEPKRKIIERRVIFMLNRIKELINNISDMLTCSNILNDIGKGAIYGFMTNSVGGGVYVQEALK